MRATIGDRVELAIFIIVTLYIAKFALRHIDGGAFASQVDNF